MKNIYSHKLETGDYLPWIEHTQSVSNRALAIVRSKQFQFPSFDREDVQDAVNLCAYFHDFGKGTRYFQIYLKTPHGDDLSQRFTKAGLLSNERLKDHSLLSGLCAFKIASEAFSNKREDIKDQITAAIFLACVSHHSSLKSQGWVSDTLGSSFEYGISEEISEMYKTLDPQMFTLSFPTSTESSRQFNAGVCKSINIKDLAMHVRKTVTKVASLSNNFEFNIFTMFLYSILLEADKFWLITGQDENLFEPYNIDDRLIDLYRLQKFTTTPKTALNDMRNQTYEEVQNALSVLTPFDIMKGNFWTLSLPTGMGKTLILANAGLKIAKGMKEAGMRPKVIVALPFLSVIEQSYEEYARVLGKGNILKYHSLSDLGAGAIADGTDRDTVKFHADIWDKPFIVTTFDQLLYAFLSEKKAFASRFHNLFNAVVLLDEIQGVPYKAWPTFSEFVNLLCKIGKSHFIISSATCPDFGVQGKLNLVSSPERYYSQLNRTKLNIRLIKDPVEENELCDLLETFILNHENQSFLIILNTIHCAQNVYLEISRRYPKKPIYSLTAALLPIHRAMVIAKIKKDLEGNKAPILVSTQTVEAGVDLDCDVTVRDIAPLDSIIQAAGRTNRNWNKIQPGIVYLICVKSKGKWHSHTVYGRESGGHSIEVDATMNAFIQSNSDELSEKTFLGFVQEYFGWLNKQSHQDTDATSLKYALKTLSFDLQTKTIRQMLRGEDEKVRIFLTHDQKSQDLLKRTESAWKLVQNERFKIYKWEMALLDVRGAIAENTIGVYKWVAKSMDMNYIDPSKELFPYVDATNGEDIYDFNVHELTGVGFCYERYSSRLPHTLFV